MHHLATLATPPKPARFDHSSRLSERKRALFPSQIQDGSDDSDIGHMSPLEYSSSPEQSPNLGAKRQPSPPLEPLEPMLSDDSNDAAVCTGRFSPDYFQSSAQNQENIDPKNSPKKPKSVTFESEPKSPDMSDTVIPGTPSMSPTEILKTPHDSSNATNVKLPRLVRKSLIDITNIDATSLKRKPESPLESPANKTLKFDHQLKTSKARTALFPESIFPAKSFYPKREAKNVPVYHVDLAQKSKMKAHKKPPVYLCNRSRGHQPGLINAGVRHKIKKPRFKPALTKTQLLKAALNIVKNSPLNDYFDDLDKQSVCSENECGVSFEQIQKMDSILKNLDVKTVTVHKKPDSPQKSGTKRCRSPQIDQTKKFFKSGHANKATITITNNIKFQLDHGEMNLIEKQNKVRRTKRETVDFADDTSPKMLDNSFTDILQTLEDDTAIPPSITPPQNANNPVNQMQLHHAFPQLTKTMMLLSPTSLVCDLTSGLALDSPKNQLAAPATLDKLSTLKKRISFPENMDNNSAPKLFPIFGGKQSDPKPAPKENKHVKNIRKIWKPLSENQTLIDAGQKKFGVSQCAECKFVYSLGEPEDEIMHYQHHNNISVLRYNAWKHERVVHHFSNGKVILVNGNDPKPWLKKVKDVLEIINRELGFVDVPFHMTNQKVFLCIINKQIVGCLVAEPKTHAYKMCANQSAIDECTEQSYPVKCGVSRLWVAATQRKKGVATCLMNAVRLNFMYGHILTGNEVAFSAPTEAGKKFASKYMKTEEFFIYTS